MLLFLFFDLRRCFLRRYHTPHFIKRIHVKGQGIQFSTIVCHRGIGEPVELCESRNILPHLRIIGMKICAPYLWTWIPSTFRCKYYPPHWDACRSPEPFPSVSRFSREHCSVQTGTDDQIIVFHSFYMFPFSQTHLDTFLY